jgi:hypothetical protein
MSRCFQFQLAPLHNGDANKKDLLIRQVGRCMLAVSKPELKARLVSALETKM